MASIIVIVFHRISVILQTVLVGLLFFSFTHNPPHALLFSIITLVIFSALQARLLGFDIRSWSFWIFFSTPIAFLFGAIFFSFFLELVFVKWVIGILVTVLLWLYLENVFTFYHLPGAYQPYSLEYLSLAMYLLFTFFFSSGLYAAQIFLSISIIISFLALFWIFLFASICTFWMSKVNAETSWPYALTGAVGLSELYVALGLLPTSFMVNASVLTLCYYTYLGLVRAYVLEELTVRLTRRYLIFVGIAILLLFLTTTWK